METWTTRCPSCGAERITTIRLPSPHEPSEAARTHRAFRCLGCDTQWSDEEGWRERHEGHDDRDTEDAG